MLEIVTKLVYPSAKIKTLFPLALQTGILKLPFAC
jgi:hypothetical protein